MTCVEWVLLPSFPNKKKKEWKYHSTYFPETCPSDSHLPAKGHTPCSAAGGEPLTDTQDVETEPLRSRLVDQLVGKTVKSNMARKGQVSKLFILEFQRRNVWESTSSVTWVPHITGPALSLPFSVTCTEKKASLSTHTCLGFYTRKVLIIPKPHSFHKIDYLIPKVDCPPRCLMPCYTYSAREYWASRGDYLRYVLRDIKNSNHVHSFEYSRRTFTLFLTPRKK